MERYKNKQVLLATKHAKEQVIQPVFKSVLHCQVNTKDFDTDKYGTFSGEIPRPLGPYQTCILKAKEAAEKFGYELSIASEGSYGPHPFIPFIPGGHEVMIFWDKSKDWIIAEQLITEKTNYSSIYVDSTTNIEGFLRQMGFPGHALIMQTATTKEIIAKGINDIHLLQSCLKSGYKVEDRLLLTTDMRAMLNPTRMKVLSELAIKLANRIKTNCPGCWAPGFGFKKTQDNLLCQSCDSPTSLYKFELYGCVQCCYEESKPRKDGLEYASPEFCNYCNP